MLTLPSLTTRPAIPYLALRADVTIPFGDQIGPIMDRLFADLDARRITPAGPVFFKYNTIAMPRLNIDFAVPLAEAQPGDDTLVSGTLPAGRYAEIDWFGHYDDLMTVNAVLLGWVDHCGLALDMTRQPDGDHFAARLEIYHNSPEEAPNPADWHTTLCMKLSG